ncbi:phosphohydrolase [Ralstonia pseudosolanacearum]|uniref:phosphohydrolase n=1 Tax=Ralstonia pseudosolanacearum TaxID=1310165 RepID=UPI003CF0E3B6
MVREMIQEWLARALLYVFGPRRMRTPISTFTGQHFNPLASNLEELIRDIEIDDIAQGLSNICRFNGQTTEFYSVAQHSVMVCDLVPAQYKRAALFHDGSEPYLGDMIKPLKLLFPLFWWIERRVMTAIAWKFGFSMNEEVHRIIKRADMIALATERRDLMPKSNGEWQYLEGYHPVEGKLVPLPPREARELFMQRYRELFLT